MYIILCCTTMRITVMNVAVGLERGDKTCAEIGFKWIRRCLRSGVASSTMWQSRLGWAKIGLEYILWLTNLIKWDLSESCTFGVTDSISLKYNFDRAQLLTYFYFLDIRIHKYFLKIWIYCSTITAFAYSNMTLCSLFTSSCKWDNFVNA